MEANPLKTLFLVKLKLMKGKVICSPTSLKVWPASLYAFIIDYISTQFDTKSCMLNIILYIAIFSDK